MKEGRIKNIEKTLFKFIFSPSTLKADKRKFISTNKSIFSRELELLVNFKDQLDKKIPLGLVEKIKERINKLNKKKKNHIKKG